MIPKVRQEILQLSSTDLPFLKVGQKITLVLLVIQFVIICQEFRNIFLNLERSVKRSYDTRPFCDANVDSAGRPMQPHIQVRDFTDILLPYFMILMLLNRWMSKSS